MLKPFPAKVHTQYDFGNASEQNLCNVYYCPFIGSQAFLVFTHLYMLPFVYLTFCHTIFQQIYVQSVCEIHVLSCQIVILYIIYAITFFQYVISILIFEYYFKN